MENGIRLDDRRNRLKHASSEFLPTTCVISKIGEVEKGELENTDGHRYNVMASIPALDEFFDPTIFRIL